MAVFYRDVLILAREADAAEYWLLAYALAHEIGHLLLGPNSYSATGVMRGQWNHADLKTIARAYLFFSDQQSQQAEKRLQRATRFGRNKWQMPEILDLCRPDQTTSEPLQ